MSAVSARRLADKELIVVPYRRVSVSALATNVVLILLGCFFLLPLLWMVFASVDANPDWAIKIPTPTLGSLPELFEIIPTWARQLLQFTVQNVLELKSDDIFNTLSDPTTGIDPAPEPGPGLN